MKNLVLDMGNVCCRWDPVYIASQLTSSKQEQDFLVQYVFGSVQWQKLDQGTLTVQEAISQLQNEYSQYRQLIEYAICHWYDYFEVIDEMEELIKEYAKKYDFYLLSNCSVQFDEYYQEKSIFKYFKGYYISAKHHLVKPSKEIFLDFINCYHLDAKDCFFIDDILKNVEGAKLIGMKGFCFDGDILKLKNYLDGIENEGI